MKADNMLDLVRINRDNWEDFLNRLTRHSSHKENELLRDIFNDLKEELEAKERAGAKRGDEETRKEAQDTAHPKHSNPSESSLSPALIDNKKTPGKTGTDAPCSLPPAPKQGHGRRGARDFEPSEIIHVPASFPETHGESTSEYSHRYQLVIKGSLSFKVCLYVLPRRRLASGALQTTPLPKNVGPLYGKADAEAAVSLAFQHYKLGATLYGVEKFQTAVGFPMPQSTQWDIIEAATNVLFPVCECFKTEIANARVLHIDSTGKTILETRKIIKERQQKAVAQGKKPESVRHGMRSSVALAKTSEGNHVVFVKTGEEHAGEVLDDILARRTVPGQVLLEVDGSAENTDHRHRDKTILCICNAHAFRKFRDHINNFPDLKNVVSLYGMVFKNEAYCLKQNMTEEQRLYFHATHSLPLMNEIQRWLLDYLEIKKATTPNSPLGVDIRYFLKRFQGLTQFCRHEGAPLHNNANEQAIKVTVKHRKNSLFFKTKFGAYVGDIWMSLIETALLNKVNPWQWCVEMLRHPDEVRRNPQNWMPWMQGQVEMQL